MATANTIKSLFSLINSASLAPAKGGGASGSATRATTQTVSLPLGETFRLPASRHVSVLGGQVWLTHLADSRDHFPRRGNSFDTGEHTDSVVEALSDATLLIE